MNTKTKEIEVKALDARVLAVAVEGAIGDWAAYIGFAKTATLKKVEEFAKKFRWRH